MTAVLTAESTVDYKNYAVPSSSVRGRQVEWLADDDQGGDLRDLL